MSTTKHTPVRLKKYKAIYSRDRRDNDMTRSRWFLTREEANAFLRKMYNCGYSTWGVFTMPAIAKAQGGNS